MNAPLSEPLVQVLQRETTLRLVLNRPRARNALSAELMAALQSALDAAADDKNTRVIVLAAKARYSPRATTSRR